MGSGTALYDFTDVRLLITKRTSRNWHAQNENGNNVVRKTNVNANPVSLISLIPPPRTSHTSKNVELQRANPSNLPPSSLRVQKNQVKNVKEFRIQKKQLI